MGLAYFSAICIVALFGKLYAQSPDLSTSFSFRATGRTTISGQSVVYDPYLVYNDAVRGLLKLDFLVIASGQQTNASVLVNRMGDEEFTSVNGGCTRTMSISQASMPAVLENADTWSKFNLVSTNGTVRIYTAGTNTLTTTNGIPTRLTYVVQVNGRQTRVVLTINSYTDSAPAFTIFQLDSACVEDGYICENCYIPRPPLSNLFSFMATGTATTQGQTIILNSYSVFNDGFRGFLKLEFTSTASGQQTNTNVLFNRGGHIEFTTTSDQCTRAAPSQGSLSSVLDNADPWSAFTLMSIAGDVRTYTSGTNTLITTNGVPTSLTYVVQVNGRQTRVVLTINSYTESAPAFTIFQLDSACVEDGYICENCYNSRPPLSNLFSFMATGTATTQGQTIILNSYSVFNDGFRGFLKLEFTSTASGQQTNTNVLFNRGEHIEFTTTSDQCTRAAPSQGSLSSVLDNADPWSAFTLMSIAGDVRTYTSGTNTLITTNGVPTSLTYSVPVNGQPTRTTLTITSYIDSHPAFSIFQLDPACIAEGYTCGGCYNVPSSAIGIASNFVCIITTLMVLSMLSIAA